MSAERRVSSLRSGEPPRALLITAVVVLAASVIMMFWGAVATGISYDEPFHVMRLQNWFDHGWYLLDDDLVGDQVGEWVDDSFVYAPVATLLLHLLNVAVGNETWGTVETSAQSYAVRHLGVAAMTCMGVAATAVLGRILLRSWRWGVICAATLVAIPLWTGMAMFNVKDSPVAVGYTIATLGLVVLIGESSARWRLPVAGALAWAGGMLAIGVRPGIWPGIAAAYGLAVIVLVLCRPGGTGPALRRLVVAAVSGAMTLVALAWVYPVFYADPDWLLRSVFSSANYQGAARTRFSVVVLAFGVVPSLLLFLSLASWAGAARRARPGSWRLDVTSARWVLLGSQALLLISLAVAKGSHLHGLRQLLFVVPAFAVLSVWGIRRAYLQARDTETSKWEAKVLAVATAFALLVPTVVQARSFPYGYTYTSALIDFIGVETTRDFWRLSYREFAPELRNDEFVICSDVMLEEEQTYARFINDVGRSIVERSRDCRTDYLSPIAPFRDLDIAFDEPVGSTFLVASSGQTEQAARCADLASVTRVRHFREQRMSVLRRCELALMAMPSDGLEFTPQGEGSEYLLGGWTGNNAETGVVLLDRRGDLGVSIKSLSMTGPLEVAISLHNDVAVEVSADNSVIAVLEPGSGVRTLQVPADWGRVVDGGLVLTLRAAADGEVRMHSLQVEQTSRGSR